MFAATVSCGFKFGHSASGVRVGALAVADGSREARAAGASCVVPHVYLKQHDSAGMRRWPRFTMLGQSIGSMVVAFQGLRACTPHVFLDTTGCAFTYFVAKVLAGLPVATYTHYPTITSVCCRCACPLSVNYSLRSCPCCERVLCCPIAGHAEHCLPTPAHVQ